MSDSERRSPDRPGADRAHARPATAMRSRCSSSGSSGRSSAWPSPIVRDEIEADTITQDTFVQAYTHLAKFEGRAELETWLTRIAINRSRDSLRRRRFVSLFTLRRMTTARPRRSSSRSTSGPIRSGSCCPSQLRAAIERAERQLSAQQKVDLPPAPLREPLARGHRRRTSACSAGTVRAHLFRAIHKIRKELAGWRTSRGLQGTEHEAALQ